MSQQLQAQQRKSMISYFQDQVALAVQSMQGLISSSEARRLTLNLVSAAEDSIEKEKDPKKKFKWDNNNARRFLTQVIKSVTAGLDAANGEVYAYPYGNKMEVVPSYRGVRKMVKEYAVGKVVMDIRPFVVREGDKFSVSYGLNTDDFTFEPESAFNMKDPVGYVTVALYEDGTCRVMTHTLEDIEKRKKANPQGTSPAWKNWPLEMAMAKAIKRHAKSIDIRLKPEAQELISRVDDEEIEFQDVTPAITTIELTGVDASELEEPEEKVVVEIEPEGEIEEAEAKEEDAEPPKVKKSAPSKSKKGAQVEIDEDWMSV